MAYYNYHACAKKLICEGHLTKYEIYLAYNKISPALVLFFDNHRPMPIRYEHWQEYFSIIENLKRNF